MEGSVSEEARGSVLGSEVGGFRSGPPRAELSPGVGAGAQLGEHLPSRDKAQVQVLTGE